MVTLEGVQKNYDDKKPALDALDKSAKLQLLREGREGHYLNAEVNTPRKTDKELQEMAKSYGNLPNNRTNGKTFDQQMRDIENRKQTADDNLSVSKRELQERKKQLETRQNNLRKEQLEVCEKKSSYSFCPKLCEVNSSHSFCPTTTAAGGARKSRKHKRTRKHMRKHTRKHKVMKSKMTKSKSKKEIKKKEKKTKGH
jgi:hypothetical protein